MLRNMSFYSEELANKPISGREGLLVEGSRRVVSCLYSCFGVCFSSGSLREGTLRVSLSSSGGWGAVLTTLRCSRFLRLMRSSPVRSSASSVMRSSSLSPSMISQSLGLRLLLISRGFYPLVLLSSCIICMILSKMSGLFFLK